MPYQCFELLQGVGLVEHDDGRAIRVVQYSIEVTQNMIEGHVPGLKRIEGRLNIRITDVDPSNQLRFSGDWDC